MFDQTDTSNLKQKQFIKEHKLDLIYNLEYLLDHSKLQMDLSLDTIFELIKSVDRIEYKLREGDPLLQFRDYFISYINLDPEDDISDVTFQEYISLKLQELA